MDILKPLSTFWQMLTAPHPSIQGIEHRRQARLLSSLLLPLVFLPVLILIARTIIDAAFQPSWIAVLSFFILALGYILSRTRFYKAGAVLAASLFPVSIFALAVQYTDPSELRSLLVYLVLGVLLGSMLFSVRGTAVLAVINLIALIVIPFVLPRVTFSTIIPPLAFLMLSSTLIVVAMWHRNRLEMDRQAELVASEERAREINKMLRAILDINQLITREKDRQRLLQSACESLLTTSGYLHTWIALVDQAGGLSFAAEAGLGDAALTYAVEQQGEMPSCARQALFQPGILSIENPREVCGDCPLQMLYRGDRAIITRMEHDGTIYGVLVVHGSKELAPNEATQVLFQEIAGDLAFALRSIERNEERKRAQDEIYKLNRELEQRVIERTAQLEAANQELEAFAYSVSHDLRAPLRGVEGYSRLLLEDYSEQLPDPAHELLEKVRAAVMRMSDLINALLAFSRLARQPINREDVDVRKVVDRVISELEHEVGSRQINWTVGALPGCSADPALLYQVFANLVSNAIKYSQVRPIAHIEIGSQQHDEETVYYVRDDGVGFDMSYAAKLFGVFQRLHHASEFEGTGIGLANVQRIIQRHGGRIWAESEPDRGATFFFTLAPTREAHTLE